MVAFALTVVGASSANDLDAELGDGKKFSNQLLLEKRVHLVKFVIHFPFFLNDLT